jgi:hypothetical protein
MTVAPLADTNWPRPALAPLRFAVLDPIGRADWVAGHLAVSSGGRVRRQPLHLAA